MVTCPDGDVAWIAQYFGECVHSTKDIASFYIGLSSIAFWLFAQMPQIYTNFKLKEAESLSILFLLAWLGGDSSNLIGCFLTKQLPTQTYTAIYFMAMDAVLLSQFIYFSFIRRRKFASVKEVDITTEKKPLLYSIPLILIPACLLFIHAAAVQPLPNRSTQRTLLASSTSGTEKTATFYIGQAVGWISASLYLSSRVPQIIKNFQRQSTEGILFLVWREWQLWHSSYSDLQAFLVSCLPWQSWET